MGGRAGGRIFTSLARHDLLLLGARPIAHAVVGQHADRVGLVGLQFTDGRQLAVALHAMNRPQPHRQVRHVRVEHLVALQ